MIETLVEVVKHCYELETQVISSSKLSHFGCALAELLMICSEAHPKGLWEFQPLFKP